MSSKAGRPKKPKLERYHLFKNAILNGVECEVTINNKNGTKDHIKRLITCQGSVTNLCKLLGVHQSEYYHLCNLYPDLITLMQTAKREIIDIAESKLYYMVKKGHFKAIVYLLSTKGGYVVNSKLETTVTKQIETIKLVEVRKPDE